MNTELKDTPSKEHNNSLYIRDGRAPIPKRPSISVVMSANKGKNTKPEIKMRQALWAANLRGYRIHLRNIPGHPDIVFTKQKLAIFVNGCFWHRCPQCKQSYPKTHKYFWKNKFERNIARDREKVNNLKALGWKTLVLWECQIKADVKKCIKKVEQKTISNE